MRAKKTVVTAAVLTALGCTMSLSASASAQHVADVGGASDWAAGVAMGDFGGVEAQLGPRHEDSVAGQLDLNLSVGRQLSLEERAAFANDLATVPAVKELHGAMNDRAPGTWALMHVDVVPTSGEMSEEEMFNPVATPHVAYVTFEKVASPGMENASGRIDESSCAEYSITDARTGELLDSYGFCPLSW